MTVYMTLRVQDIPIKVDLISNVDYKSVSNQACTYPDVDGEFKKTIRESVTERR